MFLRVEGMFINVLKTALGDPVAPLEYAGIQIEAELHVMWRLVLPSRPETWVTSVPDEWMAALSTQQSSFHPRILQNKTDPRVKEKTEQKPLQGNKANQLHGKNVQLVIFWFIHYL